MKVVSPRLPVASKYKTSANACPGGIENATAADAPISGIAVCPIALDDDLQDGGIKRKVVTKLTQRIEKLRAESTTVYFLPQAAP